MFRLPDPPAPEIWLIGGRDAEVERRFSTAGYRHFGADPRLSEPWASTTVWAWFQPTEPQPDVPWA